MSLELKQYVKDALSRGANKDGLLKTLTESGWSEEVVNKTLDQYVGVDANGVPIPAPRMQAHQIARDIFLYFLSLVTLSMTAFALGGLLFELVNQYVPDKAATEYYYSHSVNWAIAQLVVAFPVFTLLTRMLGKDIANHPEKRESLIRKLMIYLILVITAVVSLGDLVTVLTTFLEGDITMRFMLKALIVLGISMVIFTYYMVEVRRDDALVRRGKGV